MLRSADRTHPGTAWILLRTSTYLRVSMSVVLSKSRSAFVKQPWPCTGSSRATSDAPHAASNTCDLRPFWMKPDAMTASRLLRRRIQISSSRLGGTSLCASTERQVVCVSVCVSVRVPEPEWQQSNTTVCVDEIQFQGNQAGS